MRRYIAFAGLVLLAVILQSTVFNYITVAGVKPDLVLILVIFYALLHGPRQGVVFGFIAGLLVDFYIGRYIGMNALTKMTVGYLCGWMETKLYKENLLIPALALFLGSLVGGFIEYFLGVVVNYGHITVGQAFWQVILPGAIYNSCLAPFMYSRFYKSATKGWLRAERFTNSV